MAAEHPGPDPRTLWREQEQETDAVTLDQIHALVSRYDRKMRFFPLIVAVSLVIVGLIGGHQWAGAHDTLDRVLAVLFILGEAGAFIVGYRMAFPRRDPTESAGAYLRRRLQLKLATARGGWMLILAPILPFMLLLFYKMAQHPPPHGLRFVQTAPVVALWLVWLVVFLVRRHRGARDSKAELAELDALMRR